MRILESIRLSCLIFAALTVALSSITVYSQAQAWQQYKADGFSVMLPELPTTMEISRPSKMFEERGTARLFGAYEDGIAYVILSFNNPQQRDPLSRFIEELDSYNISGNAETFRRDLEGPGLKGKEYYFGSSPALNGIVRFYLTQERAYIVEAIGDDTARPSVKQFLDSFRLASDERAESPTNSNPRPIEGAGATPDTSPEAKVMTGREVTTKARVLVKPAPMYTEAARQAKVEGTVVLRAIFTSSGHVTNVRAVSGLPNGLTEQAVLAARNIKFLPAVKDGHYVSMYIQLEYNFNLY